MASGFWNRRDVAKYFSCSLSFLRTLEQRGELEFVNGDIPVKDVEDFIERKRSQHRLLPIEEIVKGAKRARISGVYFLMDHKKNVVYIGQSKNLFARIGAHIKDNSKLFTHYAYIEIHPTALSEAERDYIQILKPKFNIMGLKWLRQAEQEYGPVPLT